MSLWIVIGLALFLVLMIGWAMYRHVPPYKITLVFPPSNVRITGTGNSLNEIVQSIALKAGKPARVVREKIREDYHAIRYSLEQQHAWPILAEIMHVPLDEYISTAIDRSLWQAVVELVPKCGLNATELEALLKICPHPASQVVIKQKLELLTPTEPEI